jgi:hypothetical protein
MKSFRHQTDLRKCLLRGSEWKENMPKGNEKKSSSGNGVTMKG